MRVFLYACPILFYACYTLCVICYTMVKEQVNVRLPSDLLSKIDSAGKRSDIIRTALYNYFAEGDVKQLLYEIREIKVLLDLLLKHKSDVHVHLPDSFNIKKEPKRLGFWARLRRS